MLLSNKVSYTIVFLLFKLHKARNSFRGRKDMMYNMSLNIFSVIVSYLKALIKYVFTVYTSCPFA